MDHLEFRQALQDLGVSQRRLTRLYGCDKTTVNGWAVGRAPVPSPVAVLLRILLQTDLAIGTVEEIVGLTPWG